MPFGLTCNAASTDWSETVKDVIWPRPHATRIGDRRRIEDETAADGHEVLLAGLGHDLAGVEQRGVSRVDDDLAPADPARRVAPFGERLGELRKFNVETR